MKGKRILYVINNTDFLFSHWYPPAQIALRDGFEVHLAALASNTRHTGELEKAGIVFHPTAISQGRGSILQEAKTFLSFYQLYLRVKPDLVHHIGLKQVLYGGIASRLTGVPAVVNAVTGLGYSFIAQGLKARMIRAAIIRGLNFAFGHKNHRLVVENPDDRDMFLRARVITPDNVVLIKGSGVDLIRFSPGEDPEGDPIIILASRMLWDKGVREFVEAARLFREWKVPSRFVLVGDTDAKNPAAVPRGQLQEWNESGVVEWWGYRNDMADVLAKSSIVCLPSYREGMPKVLIEAAACGRAIVTTDEPGCREVVRHLENGLLVPSRNPVALANALRRLTEDPGLRKQMGAKGRALAEADFSIERMVSDTLNVYEKLLTLAMKRY